jgi:uncharacterized protein YceK
MIRTLSVLIAVAALTLLSGCMSITGLEKELAKDPAAVHLEVRSIYGVVILDRNFPTDTNSVAARRH